LVSGVYRSRLSSGPDESAEKFMSSIEDDDRILLEDILGTMAHDIMLYEQKIISHQDLREILTALDELRILWLRGEVTLDPGFEDVHEFVEDYVLRKIGLQVGGKLHTGRSRNDQVALDQRMTIRKELNEISQRILHLIEVLLERAADNSESLMIGYTHTQHAQTTSFGHYLIAYADAVFRDFERLRQSYARLNHSPLGACALAGSSFPLDRERTAQMLGFDGLVENSIDAVSSRDFIIETLACLAILMTNLSRFSEDLILWSSSEFGYVEVSDAYASTSSVMPQKKNPCTLELIRGKTGIACGELTNLLTILKGLMTGYNRDLQEVKRPIWTSIDNTKDCLTILAGAIRTLKINRERMLKIASDSYALAIDLAEELVKKGLSFRESHRLVGTLVRDSVESKKTLSSLTPDMIDEYSQKILGKQVKISADELKRVLDPLKSLSSRLTVGSPSPEEVKRMVGDRRKKLNSSKESLETEVKRIERVWSALLELVKSIKEAR
jgi:argininosuccinate lyase